jgi:hypothetical protein
MGYTTDFTGQFIFDKPLAPEHQEYLFAFANARHVQWNVKEIAKLPDPVREAAQLPIGAQGAYFIAEEIVPGKVVKNYNYHGENVPALYCQWIPTPDGTALVWDGIEKFNKYVEWLEFLIAHFLAPWGYTLTGSVAWEGEYSDDTGVITIIDNRVDAVKTGGEETDVETASQETSGVYYRLFVNRQDEAVVVTIQWFDEHDYDQSRFINDEHYPSESDAETALISFKQKANIPLTVVEQTRIASADENTSPVDFLIHLG